MVGHQNTQRKGKGIEGWRELRYNVGYSVLFYHWPQHCNCLGMSQKIQTFCALELLCLLHW
jgi:hypothetical protein